MLATLLAGCETGPLATLIPDTNVRFGTGDASYFTIDWEPEVRGGRPILTGHVRNDAGFGAQRIRLLVEGLDAGGAVVTTTLAYVAGDLPPGIRSYWETRLPAASPAYRVRLLSVDWIQALD